MKEVTIIVKYENGVENKITVSMQAAESSMPGVLNSFILRYVGERPTREERR